MRLIDADALKAHKFVGIKFVQIGGRTNGKTLESVNRAYQQGWNDCIDAIIDNAPSIITWNKEVNKLTRPQGEWVYGEDDCGQDGWFCSECDFFVPWYYQYYEKDIDFIRDYKVCPHCLAEMITYTGKDRDTKGGAEE